METKVSQFLLDTNFNNAMGTKSLTIFYKKYVPKIDTKTKKKSQRK